MTWKTTMVAALALAGMTQASLAGSVERIDSIVTGERETTGSITLLSVLEPDCGSEQCKVVMGDKTSITMTRGGVATTESTTTSALLTSSAPASTGPARVINTSFAAKFPDPAAPSFSNAPAPKGDESYSYQDPNFDENGNPVAPADVGEVPPQEPLDGAAPTEQADGAPMAPQDGAAPDQMVQAAPEGAATNLAEGDTAQPNPLANTEMELRTGS